MRSIFTAAALVALAVSAGCTQRVDVKPISVAPPNPAKQRPGKYVASLGAFPTTINIQPGQIWAGSLECQGMNFDTDLRPVYETALKAALASAFQQVDFVPAPLSPKELLDKGYAGEFVFGVGSLTGAANPSYDLVGSVTYTTQLEAQGSMYYVDAAGPRQPVPVSGMGVGSTGFTLICTQIGGALGDAAHDALTILVQRELDAARNAVGGAKHG
ncbi:MAG TPA: hypothetical protein VKS60_04620 [Stellaceae bacterium]|nr:hypothetical protein [Stellaceae bacterium]